MSDFYSLMVANANGGKPYISSDYEANLAEAKALTIYYYVLLYCLIVEM